MVNLNFVWYIKGIIITISTKSLKAKFNLNIKFVQHN
jgi:hypothetical protein